MTPERYGGTMIAIAGSVGILGMLTTFWDTHWFVWVVRWTMLAFLAYQVWFLWRFQAIVAAKAEVRARRADELLRLEREAAAAREAAAPYERAQRDNWHDQAMEKARVEAQAGGPGLSPAIAHPIPTPPPTDAGAPQQPRRRNRDAQG